MFVFANAGAVSIVVKLDQLRPPPKKHRMTRGKQHVDRSNEGIGPRLDRTNRSLSPVKAARQFRHLSIAKDAGIAVDHENNDGYKGSEVVLDRNFRHRIG